MQAVVQVLTFSYLFRTHLQHYLATRNLKHGLEERETLQELKDHGIYQVCFGFDLHLDHKNAASSRLPLD